MSVAVMTAVFNHSASKGASRLVLLALADVASDDGEVTAYRRSQSILAGKANVDANTVRRAIANLVELGEVEVLARGEGRASANYRLVLPGVGAGVEPQRDAGAAPTRRGVSPNERLGQPQRDAGAISSSLSVVSPSLDVTSRAVALPGVVPTFDEWWSGYPRKLAKPEALKAWEAVKPPAEVIAGLARWCAYWKARGEPEFVPHPSTWLRRRQWEDEPPPPPKRPGQTATISPAESFVNGRIKLDRLPTQGAR